ncbi:MAG: hypothetical protein ACJAUL_000907 [Paraglaciecola sp.]|jgi:hypothetical protein
MHCYFFNLQLSYARCETLYRPDNNSVVVVAENGKRIQLPATNLRPFVQRNGIQGRFKLLVTPTHKIHSLEKMS